MPAATAATGAVLLCGAALATASILLDGPAATAAVVVAAALAVGGGVIGTVRHRHDPQARRPQSLLLAGIVLLAAATLVTGADPDPGPADWLALAAYVPFTAAAVALRVAHRRGEHRRDRLDTAVVGTSVALVMWMSVAEPLLDGSRTTALTVLHVGLPVAGVVLFAASAHLLLRAGPRSTPSWLLVAGFTALWIGDAAATWVHHGNAAAEPVVGTARLVACILVGAAAAHPSLRPSVPRAADARGLGEARLATLSFAAMIPPLVLVGLLLVDDEGLDRLLVAAAACVVVFGTTLMRLWDMMRETRELAFRRSERRFAAMVENSTDVIALVDPDGSVRYVSQAVGKLLDTTPDACIGHHLRTLVHPDDAGVVDRVLADACALPPGEAARSTVRTVGKGGTRRFAGLVVANLLEDDSIAGLVVTLGDMTERAILEQELSHQAFHDVLTGLANRALFVDRVEHALRQRAERSGDQLSVLFVDLDDFKSVNDGLGHQAGDDLLRSVAARISTCTRAGDTVARLGGDEFAVLLESDGALDRAVTVAERILEVLRLPLRVGDLELAVPASIGIAAAEHGTTTETLLRDADIAMYQAKRAGKSRFSVFDARMRDAAADRLALKADLVTALDGGELHLVYQPIVELDSGRVTGAEALLRWSHPHRGPISPAMFVPLAEASGHIAAIGRWVLFQACREAAGWQAHGEVRTVGVNASGVQFEDPQFVDDVRAALADAGLPPSCLTIEITETVLMHDTERTISTLSELRELGVGIAVDDFGTGYCSLAYLQRYPVDIVKIDREFVAELTSDARGTTLAETILQMARALGLRTVAEGIETGEQLETLRRLGCPSGQGYRLSHPVDAAAFHAIVADDVVLSPR